MTNETEWSHQIPTQNEYRGVFEKTETQEELGSIIMKVVERYPQSGPYSPKRLKESVEGAATTTLSFRQQKKQQQRGKHRLAIKFPQFFSCLPQQQRRYYQEDEDDHHPDFPASTIPLMMEEELSISNNPYYSNTASEVTGSPSSGRLSSSTPGSPSERRTPDNSDHKLSRSDDDCRVDVEKTTLGFDQERDGVIVRWKSRINQCLKKALLHRRRGGKGKDSDEDVTTSSSKNRDSSSRPTLAEENRTHATECNDSEDSSIQVGGKLERSNKSAFTPVENTSSMNNGYVDEVLSSNFPTQERRHTPPPPKVQISLYPYTVEVREVAPDTNHPSPDGGFLAVSIEEECAQLVVQSPSGFDDDEASTGASSLLGIAFPLQPGSHGAATGNKNCLGVNSPHPNWLKQRMLDDVWTWVESDPMEGGDLTAPPSPTLVEKSAGKGYWGNEEMSLTTLDDTQAAYSMDDAASHQEIETLFSAMYKPMCCLAREVANGGACGADIGMLALDDELSGIHDIPFDELAFGKVSSSGSSTRMGIDPEMMMLSQLSDSESLVQPYLDDESLNGDGWTDYSDAVADMYTSMLGEMGTKAK